MQTLKPSDVANIEARLAPLFRELDAYLLLMSPVMRNDPALAKFEFGTNPYAVLFGFCEIYKMVRKIEPQEYLYRIYSSGGLQFYSTAADSTPSSPQSCASEFRAANGENNVFKA
jgi:hypothetical protein